VSRDKHPDKTLSLLWMFDLDGTLVDTVQAIIESANLARTNRGYSHRDQEELQSLVGLNPDRFFDDLTLTQEENQTIVRDFRNILGAVNFGPDDVYPGAIELLTFLKSQNFHLAIATNKPTFNAQKLLHKVELLDFFDHIQGSDNMVSKPAPDILKSCQEIFRSDSSIMVGDRVEDILAGQQANSCTIGITQTFHKFADFVSYGASFVFNGLTELAEFLEFRDGIAKLHK